jgi:capsular exopolysaccharide synthesis family protein
MYTKKNNNESNIILVSSPGPGEGKTTTIANLAITYANLGKKTLLIDSDLRKPVLHNVFKIDKSPGLTSCLIGDNSYKKIINKTDVENLDIVTSGVIPPNPSELLDSSNMINFIDNIRKDYEIVLFDSPPLIAVTDASVIFKHVDQFCLVVRAGVTQKGALERVVSLTAQAGIKITGVIMNAITQEHSYGYGYYYNYYQYYYGDEK